MVLCIFDISAFSICLLEGSEGGGGKFISCMMFNLVESWALDECSDADHHSLYGFSVAPFSILF